MESNLFDSDVNAVLLPWRRGETEKEREGSRHTYDRGSWIEYSFVRNPTTSNETSTEGFFELWNPKRNARISSNRWIATNLNGLGRSCSVERSHFALDRFLCLRFDPNDPLLSLSSPFSSFPDRSKNLNDAKASRSTRWSFENRRIPKIEEKRTRDVRMRMLGRRALSLRSPRFEPCVLERTSAWMDPSEGSERAPWIFVSGKVKPPTHIDHP